VGRPATFDTGVVTTMRSSRPQVLVSVAPRLLGEVLSMALREHGDVDVVLDLEAGTARLGTAERVDVAVVTGALPDHVVADAVIIIDGSGETVRLGPEGDEMELRTGGELDALLDLLRDVLA
jgi:hypothetical protein